MADKIYTDKALKQLFKQLPEEQLPPGLNPGILQHIEKANETRRRRNVWGVWSAVSLASVDMILLLIGIFRYLSIDMLKIFKNIFSVPTESVGYAPTLAIIVGGATLLLLFIDNRIRKFFLR